MGEQMNREATEQVHEVEERETRVWMFQANPGKYDIYESLALEKEEFWNLNQYTREVGAGDQVLIWISGADAGVYAVGTVLSDPVIRSDSSTGIGYWVDPSEGFRAKARVRVRYDRVLLERPLLKTYLQADPALWDMRILRFARGTNFPITPDEWSALCQWLNEVTVGE
jgi:5-methylcytosine-specific restriction enzyme B